MFCPHKENLDATPLAYDHLWLYIAEPEVVTASPLQGIQSIYFQSHISSSIFSPRCLNTCPPFLWHQPWVHRRLAIAPYALLTAPRGSGSFAGNKTAGLISQILCVE